MVPFIPAPVSSPCRRLDTSITPRPEAISGTNLQHGTVHSCASAKLVSKTRHFNHTGPKVVSGTNLQHGAVHPCASAKLVSKNRHFNPNRFRRQFQALTFSMVPFIPVPVPSWCRRIDTSTQTDSGRDLRHESPAWYRSFLCQCQAGVEESTLQPKLIPEVISGTNLQHGTVHSCASAKLVSKNRHFSPNWIRGPFQARISSMVPFVPDQSQARVEDSTLQSKLDPGAVSGTDIRYGAVYSCASAKLVSKNRHFNPNRFRRQFQALTFSMVQFIDASVPSWCRRIDTSTQTGSGGSFRH
jgi:AraC-like DNA-binding protein